MSKFYLFPKFNQDESKESQKGGTILHMKSFIIGSIAIGTVLYFVDVPFYFLILPSVLLSLVYSLCIGHAYKGHYKEIIMKEYLENYSVLLNNLANNMEFDKIEYILRKNKNWVEVEKDIMFRIIIEEEDNISKTLNIQSGYSQKKGKELKVEYFRRECLFLKK